MKDQGEHGQGSELGEEGPSRDRHPRSLQEQLQEGKHQKRHHGAEHQPQDALLLMEVERAHRQRAFDCGIALLRYIPSFGRGQQRMRVQPLVGGAQDVAAIHPCRRGQRLLLPRPRQGQRLLLPSAGHRDLQIGPRGMTPQQDGDSLLHRCPGGIGPLPQLALQRSQGAFQPGQLRQPKLGIEPGFGWAPHHQGVEHHRWLIRLGMGKLQAPLDPVIG